MAYAGVSDLLLGDVPLGAATDPEVWLERGAEEIDSRLGTRYVLPFPATLAPHSVLLLKRINALLATGRLLMAIDGGNDDDLHAYGRDLVLQANNELNQLVAGRLELDGAEVVDAVAGTRGPSIINQDAFSATAAFEAYTMAGANAYWQPGA